MKTITRKCVMLLAVVLSLWCSSAAHAQCGMPPAATTGSISCYAGNTSATISMNLLGGPYNVQAYIDYNYPTIPIAAYTTNDPGTTYTINNLTAGSYTIYVVDVGHGGCYDSVMFTLTEPQIFNFILGLQPPMDCSGTPLIQFQMSGGTPPYTIDYTQDSISWTTLVTTSNTTYSTTSLPLGTYFFRATDVNGCTQNSSAPVGAAPIDQMHWYVGMCGATDSSVSYLTGGNHTLSRNITLHTFGFQPFGGSMLLRVDYGDNSGIQAYTRQVSTISSPIALNHTYPATGVYQITYTAVNVDKSDSVQVVEFVNDNSDVYPGDANGDGLANNFDLLNIGMSFGSAGVVRPGASLNWVAQPCSDWGSAFSTGLDFKHADCDGNGVIDFPDTVAISQNYGQSHVLRLAGPQTAASASDPVLAIDFPAGTYAPGTPVTIPVTLGTSSVPANNVYGIAFTVNYPSIAVDPANVGVNFSNCWMGTVGTDAVAVRKNFSTTASVDIAVSRTNQINVSGFGTVCLLEMITIDNVSGKLQSTGYGYFTITNVRLIDKDGNELPVGIQQDSVSVGGPSGIDAVKSSTVRLFPNPANDAVTISTGENIEEIHVTNIFGQVVAIYRPGSKEARIETGNMADGFYGITVIHTNSTSTVRMEVIH